MKWKPIFEFVIIIILTIIIPHNRHVGGSELGDVELLSEVVSAEQNWFILMLKD